MRVRRKRRVEEDGVGSRYSNSGVSMEMPGERGNRDRRWEYLKPDLNGPNLLSLVDFKSAFAFDRDMLVLVI